MASPFYLKTIERMGGDMTACFFHALRAMVSVLRCQGVAIRQGGIQMLAQLVVSNVPWGMRHGRQHIENYLRRWKAVRALKHLGERG